ncbi:MAG: HEPN domain-containing protein [Cyclobacteriaceae bacterium]|nr:HEPN domain-containing protein [Cyclobacteriaceae bacterium]MCK5278259.1 HEPN domain-containing protein [Cyclobacteriaceae bacterium]MCK5369109.1 HEPN domain-containing protein [Cyclobacteriaceae bacterium]MCK5467891.1 HEPN domain-containing protein [Cyclobacteriaceae bacterium]
MSGSKKDLIKYRLSRAWDTFDDATILKDNKKWNSSINRLYYSAYYAVMALLLNSDLKPTTHNGTKSNFSEFFIKKGVFPKELGKMYSQLFTWRQKGDYDDLFDFDKDKVLPYFEPVKRLLEIIEEKINE